MARLRIGDVANPSSIDHADLGALESDDHPQYLTETRADAIYEPLLTDLTKLYTEDVTISSAHLLALNATPQTLVAAPDSGTALIFLGAVLFLDYGTTAYDGIAAGEDLKIRYTNGSGAIVASIETTGFLDATADAVRYVYPISTDAITPVAASALVLHLASGEVATGDSVLKLRIYYRIIDTSL